MALVVAATLFAERSETNMSRLAPSNSTATFELAADGGLSAGVDAVDLEPGLGEIKTNGGNLHGGRLLSCGAFSDDDSLAHRSRRAGAVYPIKKYSRATFLPRC
jgi:hypothetical protein